MVAGTYIPLDQRLFRFSTCVPANRHQQHVVFRRNFTNFVGTTLSPVVCLRPLRRSPFRFHPKFEGVLLDGMFGAQRNLLLYHSAFWPSGIVKCYI